MVTTGVPADTFAQPRLLAQGNVRPVHLSGEGHSRSSEHVQTAGACSRRLGGACNGAAFHVGAVQTREMAIPGGTVHALQVDDGPGRDCPRSAGG